LRALSDANDPFVAFKPQLFSGDGTTALQKIYNELSAFAFRYENHNIRPNRNHTANTTQEINSQPAERAGLETQYGQVWSTAELANDFEVLGFAAPLVVVRRRSDSKLGSLLFGASIFGWHKIEHLRDQLFCDSGPFIEPRNLPGSLIRKLFIFNPV